MSALTLQLLGRRPPPDAKRWRRKMTVVTERLVAEYGTPSLGNFRDPVKEIFYIVLSAKTTETLYQKANRRLWSRFRTLRGIADAPLREIRRCVAPAGLGQKRAPQIKAIARRLYDDFGRSPAKRLRRLSSREAFDYLQSLPGVGPKSALCVMMYSLDFDVFPVDAHAQRVLSRVGLPFYGSKHYHAQAQFPAFVPQGRSKDLHVALIEHGRQICAAPRPLCCSCILRYLCNNAAFAN